MEPLESEIGGTIRKLSMIIMDSDTEVRKQSGERDKRLAGESFEFLNRSMKIFFITMTLFYIILNIE